MSAARRLALLAGLVLLSAPLLARPSSAADAAKPAPDPAAVARAIYAKVSAGDGERGGQFLWVDPKARPRTFSKGLCALWAKADAKQKADHDGLGPIDWDPFTASQDPKVKGCSVVVERQDAKAATVAVTLVDPRGRRTVVADETVRLDLVKEGDRWAVDDVRGTVDGSPWSVRAALKAYLAP